MIYNEISLTVEARQMAREADSRATRVSWYIETHPDGTILVVQYRAGGESRKTMKMLPL